MKKNEIKLKYLITDMCSSFQGMSFLEYIKVFRFRKALIGMDVRLKMCVGGDGLQRWNF